MSTACHAGPQSVSVCGTAAFDDEKMSDYVRKTLRRVAEDELPVEAQPAD